MKRLNFILPVIAFGSLCSIAPAAFLLNVSFAGDSERRINDIIRDANDPIYQFFLILAAIFAISSIVFTILLWTEMSKIENINTAESKYLEDAEKYRQATEEFAKMQKIKSIY